VLDESALTKETQDAVLAENERKKRIEERKKLDVSLTIETQSIKEIYLDIDKETKKPLIKIDNSITKNLKQHQIEGIQFMWDSCFENVKLIESGDLGSGCVLAHCMGNYIPIINK
jgi:transcriptional regulator ATRX